MKKLLLTMSLLVMFVTIARSQNAIIFGPKVGLNISGISGSNDSNSRFGFNAGGFVNLRFTDLFAFQPEIMFSTQGNRFDMMGDRFSTRLNYLNVPLLVKLYVLNGFNVQMGPQIGFLLSSKLKQHNGDKKTIIGLNSTDLSFDVGLGYEFERLSVDARYNIGVTRIDSDINSKNGVFQISLGWKFNL